MNNRTSIVLAAVIALWSAGAAADWKNLENAYESDAAHVLLPVNASGQVIVRDGAAGKPVALKVNNSTLYFIGSPDTPPVSLDALRKAAAGDRAGTRLLTVFYDIETNVATRIVLAAG